MKESQNMEFTGERFIPTEQGRIRLEHYHRYAIVLDVVKEKDVLDVACGEGYGSSSMADVARSVIGVDISDQAVQHASSAYKKLNLTFSQGSANNLHFPDASFDVVVSFETIEHLAEQAQMLAEIRRVLRPDGLLIISSPNRPIYSEESGEHNEFHVKELDFNEFDELLKAQFPTIQYFGQRILMGSVIQPLEGGQSSFRAWHDDGNDLKPNAGRLIEPVYFVAICGASNISLPGMDMSVLYPDKMDLVKHYVGFAKWAKTLDQTVSERDAQVGVLNVKIEEVSAWGKSLQGSLAERDAKVVALNAKIQEVSAWGKTLRGSLAECDAQVGVLNVKIEEVSAWRKSLQGSLAERDAQVVALNAKIQEVSAWGKTLQSELATREQEVIDLAQDIAQWRDKVTELSDSGIKQQHINVVLRTEMMRVSDWATHINSSPIAYAAKKYALKLARTLFKALPLNLEVKHRLRNGLTRSNPLRTRIVSASMELASAQIQSALQTSSVLYQAKHRDVFIFSVIDWHFRIQRPQQLARSFAKAGRRVFFFSNHFVDTDEPGYQIEHLDPSLPLYQIKLHVKGAPAIYFAPPTQKVEAMLEASIARLIMDFAALSSVTLVEHAYWYPLVCRLPNTYRVYDCMDHHEGFGNVPEKLIEIEKDMLQQSDLVVVTSSWLESFARDFNQNIAVVRNACEYEHFGNRPDDVYVDPQGRKIVGYYGAIAEWFDLDLIRAVALANPDHLVLLVGNDTVGAGSALEGLSNVAFTGEVAYAKLPFYLYAFDVCLLPFKVIPLTLATNPVKIYEYLAAGELVVSVDLPEIVQFGDLVWRATSANEFVKLVGQAMKLQESSDEVGGRERKTFAAQQTWDHRVSELSGALRGIEMPKISVVVLTFNNLDFTKACLQSLTEQTGYPNLEIIVVDNASVDGTPSYLNEFRQQHQNTKVILNEKNIGFSAGNNVGLSAATGDYLVLLNNDTVVTRGWAMTLMRHLQADSSIGLVGPVTNNIGNEARIETTYKDISDMPVEALQYTLSNMGRILPIRNVAFFCAMMPRSTYERCGQLCEEYGLGFFEDDDYCRRVEVAGLRIVCAEDVFIHHHLSASFNKIRSDEKKALVERNKAIYEGKWGSWIPHTYRITKN